MFGLIEFLVIGGALLLLFGGSRIPGVSRALFKAVKYFKFGLRGDDDIVVRRAASEEKDDEKKKPDLGA